jgi:cell division protein FtsB
MSDKHDILDETYEIIAPHESMDGVFLRKVFIAIALVLVVLFPKIYIQSQIYFKSRQISTLTREHDVLKEENRLIRAKVERMVYNNKILNTMF